MVVARGDIWWADFGDPTGSEPGYRRPVVVVQADDLNRSRIATVLVVPLSSSLKWANAPGNVVLPERDTGLERASVAIVSQLVAIARFRLVDPAGRVSASQLDAIFRGIDVVLGR